VPTFPRRPEAGHPLYASFGGLHHLRAVGANAATACFGCHTAQKSNDFVFSRYRE
jgi:hypothetical protein